MPHHDIDDQQPYWNRVADAKTFTHPLDLESLQRYCRPEAQILDYGCGYGRLVTTLKAAGFHNTTGYDTSQNIIRRGQEAGEQAIHWISSPSALPMTDGSLDAVLLFAVLTCIPTNAGQSNLMDILYRKLKPGGILYVSDYRMQGGRLAAGGYKLWQGDPENDGVFTLAEGVTFRHHADEWLATLFARFEKQHEQEVDVMTMNGNRSKAIQMVLQK